MPSPRILLDELLGENDHAPLVSPGIPVGDGRLPSVGNSLHATAAEARRAAEAEAARLNATRPRPDPATGASARYRFRVAHHAPKQPLDAPHYHVIDEQGHQLSGHFFYGRQPIRTQKKDRPTAPAYDRATPYPGANPDTSYAQYRTEWHGARTRKAEGRQRRCLQKGYELAGEVYAAPNQLPPPPDPLMTPRQVTPQMALHPSIDVDAQRALVRMARSTDATHRDAAVRILTQVFTGYLRGVYSENQRVPALRAKRQGIGWWQIIPAQADSTKLYDPLEAPILVFREAIRNNPARLDEALYAALVLPLAPMPKAYRQPSAP